MTVCVDERPDPGLCVYEGVSNNLCLTCGDKEKRMKDGDSITTFPTVLGGISLGNFEIMRTEDIHYFVVNVMLDFW